MTSDVHPFSGGGGGIIFEYEVATLLTVEMLLSRFTRHQGVVSSISLQVGPPGFDDQTVVLELPDQNTRRIHVQCRVSQPFTRSSAKFVALLTDAKMALLNDPAAFTAGERRLAVYVGAHSPAHTTMTQLCDLARATSRTTDFIHVVEANRGSLFSRWRHCLDAFQDPDVEQLHQILAIIEVCSVDLQGRSSLDHIDIVNRLAEAWTPKDFGAARTLLDAIRAYLQTIGPFGGTVDPASLERGVGNLLPNIGAYTRRSILSRRRDASRLRIAGSLRRLGVEEGAAEMLALSTLSQSPRVGVREGVNIVTGEFGAGKTTELERLHVTAIDKLLEDPNRPIPIFMQASDLTNGPLLGAVRDEIAGLGDPTRAGVFLLVDGVNEIDLDVASLEDRLATLLAQCPGSIVVLATRQQEELRGYTTVPLPPLTEDEFESIIAAICPEAQARALRPELEDALKRPLFAIHYAVLRRERNWNALHEAELVNSLAKRALLPVSGQNDRTFQLLVDLGSGLMNSGGTPIPAASIGATPMDTIRLIRSGILRVTHSRIAFSLDVLAEWFASFALQDPEILARSLSSARRAYNWRYAFVHALRDGPAEKTDRIMEALLAHAPGVAAWAHGVGVGHERRSAMPDDQLAETSLEAGHRVLRAVENWISPWPTLTRRWKRDGTMPGLGLALDGVTLTTAWSRRPPLGREPVVQLSLPISLRDPQTEWWSAVSGTPLSGEMWPWDWEFDRIRDEVKGLVSSPSVIRTKSPSREELAWDFAHHIVRRDPRIGLGPISRAELEEIVIGTRSRHPNSEVLLGSASKGCTLSEAEAFLRDLEFFGIEQIECPWPYANEQRMRIASCWSGQALIDRLEGTTKAALDLYRHIVDDQCPGIAPHLGTYQMLPGRVVGWVTPPPHEDSYGEPGFFWHLEPLPLGSDNEAKWTTVAEARLYWEGDDPPTYFARRRAHVKLLRPETPRSIPLIAHLGLSEFASSMPATSLALRMIQEDLLGIKWMRGVPLTDSDKAIRPSWR